MNLVIDLTASEEAEISAAAKQTGMAPAELVKKLVKEHLPVLQEPVGAVPPNDESDLDANLRKWQQQDGVKLYPNVSTQELFAKWAAEDEQLTDEEREENDRIYGEIEKNGIPRVQI